MDPDFDFVASCIDEIALEGLDGITLSALWLRLSRHPRFPFPIDDDVRPFMWNTLSGHADLEFFLLPDPRPPLSIFNRYNHVDIEMGIIAEPDVTPEDIYPILYIKDGPVQGSCVTYKTRTNVTDKVREVNGKPLVEFDDAVNGWGERLVLVASQTKRTEALVGKDFEPTLELSDVQYVMLERIGRSRYHGEVTQGKCSLAVLGVAPKTLHYQRKRLLAKHLITKQIHYQRTGSGQMISGMLLHLTRFYVEKRPKCLLMWEQLCRVLSSLPNRQAAATTLRAQLGMKENSFKKMFHKYLHFVTVVSIPLREATPGLPEQQYYHINGKEKVVKGLRLNDDVDVSKLGKDEDDDEGDGDDEEEEEEEESITATSSHWPLYVDRPLVNQVVELLEEIGPDGASVVELSRCLGLPKLEMRLLCRNLERHRVVSTIMKDVGRQRVSRFVFRKFEKVSELHQQFLEERRKLLEKSEAKPEGSRKNASVTDKESAEEISNASIAEIGEIAHKPTDVKPCTSKFITSFKEDIKMWDKGGIDAEKTHLTTRLLRRANLIVETVRQEKLVDDVFKLQKIIMETEAKEGYNRIDKKSVLRLIHKLGRDGYLRSFKTVLRHGTKVKKLHLVCAPDICETDAIVRSAVDQAKFKHFFTTGPDNKSSKPSKDPKDNLPTSIHASLNALEKLNKVNPKAHLEYMPNIGRLYGICPKFVRMKNLHEFIFYLVYQYEGITVPRDEGLQLWEDAPKDGVTTSESSSEGSCTPARIPKIYHSSITWKRHVPPLPLHQGWPKGWCLMSDVLLRIPLCIFVTMVNFNHKVEGLEQYLRDPEKRLYLTAHLPQSMLNGLLYGRRYIFAIVMVAEHLANVGLLSFGPHQYKEKDQKFVYLHQKASLMDTTASKRSYFQTSTDQEYPIKSYALESLQDVEKYWFDLRQICLHTQLGCVTSSHGEAIVLERLDKKPSMIATCRPKEVDEIVDDGTIPGDKRGAAGLDSALFAHLKRNWSWMNTLKNTPEYWDKLKKQRATALPETGKENEGPDSLSYLKYLQQEEHLKPPGKRLRRLTKNKTLQLPSVKSQKGEEGKDDTTKEVVPLVSMQPNVKNRQRMRGQKRKPRSTTHVTKAKRSRSNAKVVRVVQSKKKWRVRRPYYDEKDRAALLRQRKLRVDWSPQEDTLLLLCKVASTLLHPNYYQLLVMSCITVRDLLHKFVPESNNKTSRACQRRLLYMMRNPQTAYNVAVFVGEAQQDEALMEGMVLLRAPQSDEAKRDQVIHELLERLVKKFKNAPSVASGIQLPLSVDSLHARYRVTETEKLLSSQSGVMEVKNVVDVHFSVVATLVLSSLCCTGDRTNWSFQLFRIYQQYPDTLLRSVFARLRNEKLISKKKGTGRYIQRVLPISTLPFQLSITFEYKFLSRYQPEIYSQANNMLQKLLQNVGQSEVQDETNHGIEVEAEQEMGIVATVVTLMAMRSLVFDLTVPEQAIVFDTSSCGNEQGAAAFKAHLQHWEDECGKPSSPKKQRSEANICTDAVLEYHTGGPYNIDCPMDHEIESIQVLEVGGVSDVAVEISLPDTSSTVKIPALNRASRVALYLLRQQMIENPAEKSQRSQDYFVVNSCRVQCHLRPGPWTCAQPPKPTSPSRTVPPPSQDHDYTSAGEETTLASSEGVNVLLSKDVIQGVFQTQTIFIDEDTCSSLEEMLQNCLVCSSSTKDIEDLKSLYSIVLTHKEIGVTLSDLKVTVSITGTKSLIDLLQALTQNQLVLSVGVSIIRYVALVHARPWILHSVHVPKDQRSLQWEAFKEEASREMALKKSSNAAKAASSIAGQSSCEAQITPSSSAAPTTAEGEITSYTSLQKNEATEEKECKRSSGFGMSLRQRRRHSTEQLNLHCDKVRFICRPWRKPDGKLNRPVLRTMLSSILSFVMAQPGVPFLHVSTKFLPALQPVYTLELVDILETIQCLRKVCIKAPKPSLFGTPTLPSIETPTNVDPFTEYVCLEAEIDCVLRLGQLLDA